MGEISWRTQFTELVGCKYPIQQAGMGAVASPDLAAAVSEAGGLGMVGGEGLSLPLLDAALARVRSLTSGSFGVNFIIPFLDDIELVRLAAARCRVVEFFYGTPDAKLVQIVHDANAIAAWQIGSAIEARQAVDAGCDFIIAQGVEAGGHLRGRIGMVALLNESLEAVDIPVLAAGGIGTGRALAAALASGAAGVRMGTRFVAAAESNAHPSYVQSLIDAKASDTVITDLFCANWRAAPHRVLRSCVEAVQSMSESVVGQTDGQPVKRFSGAEPLRSTSGRVDAMCLYAGESVDGVRQVQLASEIILEVLKQAHTHIRDLFSFSSCD